MRFRIRERVLLLVALPLVLLGSLTIAGVVAMEDARALSAAARSADQSLLAAADLRTALLMAESEPAGTRWMPMTPHARRTPAA